MENSPKGNHPIAGLICILAAGFIIYMLATHPREQFSSPPVAVPVDPELQAYITKFGTKPSGRHYMSIFVEQMARDPDSVEMEECTDAEQSPKGWVIGCRFRAKNGFGGYNREMRWFIINHDRAIYVSERRPKEAK